MLKKIDAYFFPECEHSEWNKEEKQNGYWAVGFVIMFVLFVYGVIS